MLVIMHDRPPARKARARLVTTVAAIGALLVSASAVVRAAQREGAVKNVILISVDSLRADHLPFFGYPRMSAPFLSTLVDGRDAILFERATAVAPSCHPSHTSMLTGLYPQQVGVPFCGEDLVAKASDFRGEALTELESYQEDLRKTPEPLQRKKISAVMNWLKIPDGTQTLASFLKSRGFRTAGFVSIWTVQGRFGYGSGFDRYEDAMPDYYGPTSLSWILRDFFRSQRRQEGSATIGKLVAFLEQQDAATPFFAFVNLADTHVPYRAPDGFGFEGEDPAAREALERTWRRRYTDATWGAAAKRLERGGERLFDLYDRSIRYADSLLERVFATLAARNLSGSTLVVITSDHGDSFGQHFTLAREESVKPFFEHSVHVWEETQHVPLILAGPGLGEAGRRGDNVSHVDLVPTILGALGLAPTEFGMGALPGRNLLVPAQGPTRVYFITFGRGRPGVLRGSVLDYPSYIGFREGDLKFFVDRKRFRDPGQGRCFLFDLGTDPDEKVNLCDRSDDAARTAAFRGQLVDWYNGSIRDRPGSRAPRD